MKRNETDRQKRMRKKPKTKQKTDMETKHVF